MGKQTSLEERMRIWALAETGWSDKEIAAEVGCTTATARKWRRRLQREGRAGMASQMGRPTTGALSGFSEQVRTAVHHMRETHPGWGASTLTAELRADPELEPVLLPSRATVARYLHEQGLTRTYERHSDLSDTESHVASRPHEVWEMDAQGHAYVPDVGTISLINLNDRYSHVRLLSYPAQVGAQRWQRHLNTEDYLLALRLAFVDWGLPQHIQVDHESVYYDNRSKSPFPTRLHLWLVALGVQLRFGRPHQPRDQGMTERSHQLWTMQVLQGQRFADWPTLHQSLRERRDFLNRQLPCAALEGRSPLQAFPDATHSGRSYHPQYEAQLLDLQRVWTYLAEGCWFRLVSKDGTFSLGGQVYYLGYAYARQQVEITFDPTDLHLCCYNADGECLQRLPIQGLSCESLMGDIAQGVNLPLFQLMLPFNFRDQQVIRLFETLPV